MKLAADCPNCGRKIHIKVEGYQGWLYCRTCQCIFISRDSLRKNWPSLYEALQKKQSVQRYARVH